MQTMEASLKELVKEAVREVLAERPAAGATDGPPTLTVKEAAGIIGVSVPTMYDITHRQDFDACITVGRKRLVLRHKLLAWMEKQAAEGVAG